MDFFILRCFLACFALAACQESGDPDKVEALWVKPAQQIVLFLGALMITMWAQRAREQYGDLKVFALLAGHGKVPPHSIASSRSTHPPKAWDLQDHQLRPHLPWPWPPRHPHGSPDLMRFGAPSRGVSAYSHRQTRTVKMGCAITLLVCSSGSFHWRRIRGA